MNLLSNGIDALEKLLATAETRLAPGYLDVDSTGFVPESEALWGNLPSFIGLTGFLERIRFAIDPNTDTFYLGQL